MFHLFTVRVCQRCRILLIFFFCFFPINRFLSFSVYSIDRKNQWNMAALACVLVKLLLLYSSVENTCNHLTLVLLFCI